MFNLKMKNMIYTIDNLFDDVFDKGFKPLQINHQQGNYSITTEDGKQKLLINVVGHNPKDVELNVTEDLITVKSETEKVNAVVGNVNLKFTIGKDYDGTSAEASIENGLLTILLDKKEERKSKKVKIKY
jgi:HSP20 family protein|tara:strand:- start:73 stop:459 length:387 start_codon:yes stop_codon:yes gene_type:complete